jgi:hypothetical protein
VKKPARNRFGDDRTAMQHGGIGPIGQRMPYLRTLTRNSMPTSGLIGESRGRTTNINVTGTDHATDAQTVAPHALAYVQKATAPGGCARSACDGERV